MIRLFILVVASVSACSALVSGGKAIASSADQAAPDIVKLEQEVAAAEEVAYRRDPLLKQAEQLRRELVKAGGEAGKGSQRLAIHEEALRAANVPERQIARSIAGFRHRVRQAAEAQWLREDEGDELMASLLRDALVRAGDEARSEAELDERIRRFDPAWDGEKATAEATWDHWADLMRENADWLMATTVIALQEHFQDDQLVADFIERERLRYADDLVASYLDKHTPKALIDARRRFFEARRASTAPSP